MQEETKLFKAGIRAEIQIKCFQTTYDAPGSAVFSFPVYDALNDNIKRLDLFQTKPENLDAMFDTMFTYGRA